MKIVFMGTPDFAVPSLRALLDAGHEIAAVYTQPDKPQGRRQVLTPSPVKVLAQEHGIPVSQPETLRGEQEQQRLQTLAPDMIVVVAYGKLLPQDVLDIPKLACVNVHGSLLPRWRGAAPIQWSVIAGDTYSGVTTMKMAAGLDTGDVLLSEKTEIGARETAGELYERLSVVGAELLCRTLENWDSIVPQPQNEALACYASMLDKGMAVVDWSASAQEIDCMVRGLNPWPVALTTLGGERMKLFSVLPEQGSGLPGQVLESGKSGLLVACGRDAVRIGQMQMVGGKKMECADFLRGHSIDPGTILGR